MKREAERFWRITVLVLAAWGAADVLEDMGWSPSAMPGLAMLFIATAILLLWMKVRR